MRRCFVRALSATLGALLCSGLIGCATSPSADAIARNARLMHDEAFAAPSQPIDASTLFALSPEMHAYILSSPAMNVLAGNKQRGLIEALYTQHQLKLDYDAVRTRTASEAFAARSGNCLSLVIMAAAFAKELDLTLQYQSAVIDETWSRSGGVYFSSGHVNITVGHPMGERNTIFDAEGAMTIDFLPADEIRGMRTRPIRENTIVAMYMNNRAAETMAEGRIDDAYWFAREAIRQDPGFMAGYNTLGVIYLHRERPADAELAFARVLDIEPINAPALSNRAMALKALGRQDEADALIRRLAQVEPNPPFEYFNRGMTAMRTGDWALARDMFSKEVGRASYYHEFQFWLGMAQLQLGDVAEARKHLKLAIEATASGGAHDIYAAKLDRINAVTQVH